MIERETRAFDPRRGLNLEIEDDGDGVFDNLSPYRRMRGMLNPALAREKKEEIDNFIK